MRCIFLIFSWWVKMPMLVPVARVMSASGDERAIVRAVRMRMIEMLRVL